MPIRRHLNYWVQTWWNDEEKVWCAWLETPNDQNIFVKASSHQGIEEIANQVIQSHMAGTLEAATSLPIIEGA